MSQLNLRVLNKKIKSRTLKIIFFNIFSIGFLIFHIIYDLHTLNIFFGYQILFYLLLFFNLFGFYTMIIFQRTKIGFTTKIYLLEQLNAVLICNTMITILNGVFALSIEAVLVVNYVLLGEFKESGLSSKKAFFIHLGIIFPLYFGLAVWASSSLMKVYMMIDQRFPSRNLNFN